jgi:NADH-ubiquinone oxidoreductase chain 6
MAKLYMLNEVYTNGFRLEFLDILSVLAILCGILVIISKNPIVSVLFLIGLFFSIAGYLMMLGLNFIGFSYLLVYVGAVSILFLFILMLINVRISELLSNTNKSIPLVILIIISFINPVYPLLPYNVISFNSYIMDNSRIYFATSKI